MTKVKNAGLSYQQAEKKLIEKNILEKVNEEIRIKDKWRLTFCQQLTNYLKKDKIQLEGFDSLEDDFNSAVVDSFYYFDFNQIYEKEVDYMSKMLYLYTTKLGNITLDYGD